MIKQFNCKNIQYFWNKYFSSYVSYNDLYLRDTGLHPKTLLYFQLCFTLDAVRDIPHQYETSLTYPGSRCLRHCPLDWGLHTSYDNRRSTLHAFNHFMAFEYSNAVSWKVCQLPIWSKWREKIGRVAQRKVAWWADPWRMRLWVSKNFYSSYTMIRSEGYL